MRKNNLPEYSGESGPVCGVLLLDKPPGPTSHDMVALVRRLSRVKKVGHGGTLDPFATGLMLILVGKATRLFDFLTPLEKEYRVRVQFGAFSTTGDRDGDISETGGQVSEEELRRVLPRFTGKITQRPPGYSAIKVGGEALYRKARRGERVEAPPRQVMIRELQLEWFDEASQQADLLVACSKGTYIRTLCEDIARSLGTGAYAAALRRTAIGEFKAAEALSREALKAMPVETMLSEANNSFISCLGALYFLPVREVDEKGARDVATGRRLTGEAEQPVRIGHGGRLLGVYGPADEGMLRPLVVLT